jgi:CHAD domain-containing protein
MTDETAAAAGPGRPLEVELKYRVGSAADAEDLLSVGRIGAFSAVGRGVRTTQLEDRYVDTIDGALARAGFAVRLRQSGGETVVTLKSLAHTDGAGGAVRRDEFEGPADRVAPAADWPASDARALVLEHAGDAPLVELVTIRQLRNRRVLRGAEARVELSLDEVDVVARGRVVERFTELEAELLRGSESALADLAAELDGRAGLRRSTVSKLEAALAAVRGADRRGPARSGPLLTGLPGPGSPTPRPTRPRGTAKGASKGRRAAPAARPVTRDAAPAASAPPAASADDATKAIEIEAAPVPVPVDGGRLVVGKQPGVAADDHVAEAGRKILRFHLARMLDFEAGTRSGLAAEDLHKMRVATRRQRAAWRVFGGAFRARRTRRYRNGLREIARRLGAVRDLDVQLEALDAYRADLPVDEQRALEPLRAAWQGYRDDARVLLIRELDSEEYRRWVDDYRDFVRAEGALVRPVGPVEPHRVRDTAPSRIWAAYEGVRGYESALRWASVETLHELRIAGKWLRYTLEFVRETLPPEAAILIARVTALQDHLGLMHDADVAASMARTYLVEHAGELSPLESAAIGRYLLDRERSVARLRRTVPNTWRGVAGLRFRRGLGRVVADL